MKPVSSICRAIVLALCAAASAEPVNLAAAPQPGPQSNLTQDTPRQAAGKQTVFNIPAQPAVHALQQFSRQAAVEVMFSYDDLRDVRANELTGAHEPGPALGILVC